MNGNGNGSLDAATDRILMILKDRKTVDVQFYMYDDVNLDVNCPQIHEREGVKDVLETAQKLSMWSTGKYVDVVFRTGMTVLARVKFVGGRI